MFEGLKALIAEHTDEAVEFGDPNSDLGPTEERINETQELLGCKLPISYLWFVQNYGGGEIYGEEIYFNIPGAVRNCGWGHRPPNSMVPRKGIG